MEKETCQYVIERKRRSCRMLVKPGHRCCGEHSGEEANRMQCPLDPKHTVDRDQLEGHLKKCNSRLNTDLPYVRPGINDGDQSDQCLDEGFALAQLTDEELRNAITKLEKIHEQLDIGTVDAFLEHGCMEDELRLDSNGTDARRHLRQQSSILAHADRLGLLGMGKVGSVCYVEFGAGRARLSYWLAKAVEEELAEPFAESPASPPPTVSYLLIERSGQRYKFENKIKPATGRQTVSQFHRIRCAIEHVDLRLVECVRNSASCVAFCKHLCGSGTDAALRCLVNAVTSSNDQRSINLSRALLAPCCHHRCDWRTFVGQKPWSQLGLTIMDFKIITAMSSWATCGLADNGLIDRKSIGRNCIQLLNYARAKYLEETGLFKVDFLHYVPEDITPENLLLVITASAPHGSKCD